MKISRSGIYKVNSKFRIYTRSILHIYRPIEFKFKINWPVRKILVLKAYAQTSSNADVSSLARDTGLDQLKNLRKIVNIFYP